MGLQKIVGYMEGKIYPYLQEWEIGMFCHKNSAVGFHSPQEATGLEIKTSRHEKLYCKITPQHCLFWSAQKAHVSKYSMAFVGIHGANSRPIYAHLSLK